MRTVLLIILMSLAYTAISAGRPQPINPAELPIAGHPKPCKCTPVIITDDHLSPFTVTRLQRCDCVTMDCLVHLDGSQMSCVKK